LPADETQPISREDWAARVHPDDLTAIRAALDEAVRNGSIYSTEYRTLTDTGTRWILGLAQVIRGGEGASDRFVGLNIDISRRKSQEEALRRAEADLMQLSRLTAMGTMGSMLAHELNQPLAAVANYLSAVRKMLPEQVLGDQPRIGQALSRAEECVLRSGDIIRRLREFVAGGKLHARAEALEPIVRESATIALEGGAMRRPELRLELAPEAARVFADRIQIQQVLVNLVRNASEAMEDVERPVIEISAGVPEAGQVEIRVSDRGGGIPAQLDDTLFSPFVTTKSEGMGVGLAICRTIVEAHGGRIWAEQRDGGGTSFRFTVPAV
jgi:two-component system sensor kinase FixL